MTPTIDASVILHAISLAEQADVPVKMSAQQARHLISVYDRSALLEDRLGHWAGIINHLACMLLDCSVVENDIDYANEMITLVTPYLGLDTEEDL